MPRFTTRLRGWFAIPIALAVILITVIGGTAQATQRVQVAAAPAMAVAAAAPAAAVAPKPKVTRAYGYALPVSPKVTKVKGTEWNGSYNNGGLMVYCPDYGLKLTYIQPGKPAVALPGKSLAVSRKIFYVVNRYGVTTSKTQAAAVHTAVQFLTGDPAWKTDWRSTYSAAQRKLDPRVEPLANKYVAEANKWYGPYKLSAPVFSKKALVGQTATAKVRVTSAARSGFPYAKMRWTISGGVITRNSVATDTQGYSTITFRRTSNAALIVAVTAADLPDVRGATGPVPAGFQHLVGKTASTSLKSRATYQVSVKGPSVTVTCSSTCNGHPPVTICGSDAAGAATIQYIPIRNSKADFADAITIPGGKSVCRTFVGTDREVIRFAYRYQISGKWTGLVYLSGSVTLDCPALPDVTVALSCNCVGGSTGGSAQQSSIVFTVPTNTTRHAWRMVVSTSSGTQTFAIAPGSGLTKSFAGKGTFGLQVGAQKASGAWVDHAVFSGLTFA